MSEEKTNSQESCCSSSGCCGGGKKFFVGILVGLILTAAAFGFYSVGQCATKGSLCPISQMQSK